MIGQWNNHRPNKKWLLRACPITSKLSKSRHQHNRIHQSQRNLQQSKPSACLCSKRQGLRARPPHKCHNHKPSSINFNFSSHNSNNSDKHPLWPFNKQTLDHKCTLLHLITPFHNRFTLLTLPLPHLSLNPQHLYLRHPTSSLRPHRQTLLRLLHLRMSFLCRINLDKKVAPVLHLRQLLLLR